MATQFRRYDSTGPQVVSLRWEMVTEHDDDSTPPDERDEGFWPSLDSDSAGFIGADKTPTELATETAKAQANLDAWRNDEWEYVGVIARAHVSIPIGGSAFTRHTFDSAGVWGVESNSGEYLAELFEEQKAELLADLEKLGRFVIAATAAIKQEA